MKILFRKKINMWIMTGLLGMDSKWFFGFSKVYRKPKSLIEEVEYLNKKIRDAGDEDDT